MTTRNTGRPRTFDETLVVDRTVDTLWRSGVAGATARVLESELGMSQSSIYNAFGSKPALVDRALDRYEQRLDEELVGTLGATGASADDVAALIDRWVEWVSDDRHRGCLLLNTIAEAKPEDVAVLARGERYRARLRGLLAGALANGAADDEAVLRADLVLAAAIGISTAARGGAGRAELDALATAVRAQIRSW